MEDATPLTLGTGRKINDYRRTKNRVDGIWDIFFAGGLTNPLDVIEQMTYLLFIHDLDESDIRRAKESAMLGLPYESIFTNE